MTTCSRLRALHAEPTAHAPLPSQVIDTVLLPFFPTIASAVVRTPALSGLLGAAVAANLVPALSDPTLNVTGALRQARTLASSAVQQHLNMKHDTVPRTPPPQSSRPLTLPSPRWVAT